VDGKEIEVYKDPITDPGKMSKKGILDLAVNDRTVQTVTGAASHGSLMTTVYDSGKIVKEYTFAEIRANAEAGPYIENNK
jgi:nicotinamide phosphoribosyltransferase